MQNRYKKAILLLLVMPLLPAPAWAGLSVFACEPEWAALAEAIGEGHVEASSATSALQDPHYIQARPSLIARVRKADLVICSGAQLEIGWLPLLLSKANNPKVLPGKPGFLEASSLVRRLEIPAVVDRSQGDMHPQGNPHIQTNPHNVGIVARALGQRLGELDPGNTEAYASATQDFLRRWNEAIVRWEGRAEPLRGKRVVAHHKSWAYLEDWLKLQEVATLEPVPGIPPTAGHLSALLADLGTDGTGADFIIRAPFQSPKPSEWLQERTGIPAVMLPLTVGGSDRAVDLFSLFDDLIDRLLTARGAPE
jgi:zinc/manganese transport system substrate-binding protein